MYSSIQAHASIFLFPLRTALWGAIGYTSGVLYQTSPKKWASILVISQIVDSIFSSLATRQAKTVMRAKMRQIYINLFVNCLTVAALNKYNLITPHTVIALMCMSTINFFAKLIEIRS